MVIIDDRPEPTPWERLEQEISSLRGLNRRLEADNAALRAELERIKTGSDVVEWINDTIWLIRNNTISGADKRFPELEVSVRIYQDGADIPPADQQEQADE